MVYPSGAKPTEDKKTLVPAMTVCESEVLDLYSKIQSGLSPLATRSGSFQSKDVSPLYKRVSESSIRDVCLPPLITRVSSKDCAAPESFHSPSALSISSRCGSPSSGLPSPASSRRRSTRNPILVIESVLYQARMTHKRLSRRGGQSDTLFSMEPLGNLINCEDQVQRIVSDKCPAELQDIISALLAHERPTAQDALNQMKAK